MFALGAVFVIVAAAAVVLNLIGWGPELPEIQGAVASGRTATAGAAARPASTTPQPFVIPNAPTPGELEGLSPDQREVASDFGWPHAFSIIYIDNAEGETVRHERWTYLDTQLTYVFLDGTFLRLEPTEEAVESFSPTPYRPNQFVAPMTPDAVRVLAVGGQWQPLPGTEEMAAKLGDSQMEVFGAQQLIAVFHWGDLIYIEAVALANAVAGGS